MSTQSGTLFGRSSIFMLLSDASKPFLFFQMVMQRHTVVVVGVEVVVACSRWQ
jgi:hypothetical protein